jgi:hypothetical protein
MMDPSMATETHTTLYATETQLSVEGAVREVHVMPSFEVMIRLVSPDEATATKRSLPKATAFQSRTEAGVREAHCVAFADVMTAPACPTATNLLGPKVMPRRGSAGVGGSNHLVPSLEMVANDREELAMSVTATK